MHCLVNTAWRKIGNIYSTDHVLHPRIDYYVIISTFGVTWPLLPLLNIHKFTFIRVLQNYLSKYGISKNVLGLVSIYVLIWGKIKKRGRYFSYFLLYHYYRHLFQFISISSQENYKTTPGNINYTLTNIIFHEKKLTLTNS